MKDEEIDLVPRLMNHLVSLEPGSKEFDTVLEQLNTLIHIEKALKENEKPSWLTTVFNNGPLLGLVGNWGLMFGMLYFERTDIITSAVRGLIRSK